MRRPALIFALLLVAGSLLAACGSDEDSETGGTEAGSSAGAEISGDGYSYDVPDGWEDATGDADEIADALSAGGAEVTADDIGAAYDSIALSDSTTDGFKTNFNVVRQPGLPDGLDSETIAQQSGSALADPEQAAQFLPEGFEINYDGSPPTRTDLGGEEAYEFEYDARVNDIDIRAKQIYVVLDGVAYVATFTAAAEAYESDLADLESITGSWQFG